MYRSKKISFLCAALLISTFLIQPLSVKSYAEGFKELNGDWYYLNKDGEAYHSRFVDDQGFLYYLLDNGKIARDAYLEIDDKYYYADSLGHILRNKFFNIDNEIADRYNTEPGLYYAGNNYSLVKRGGSTFKKAIGNSYYIFNEYGRILTGFIDEDGTEIIDEDRYIDDTVYYADERGALKRNSWIDIATTVGIYNVNSLDRVLGSEKYDDLNHVWLYFGNDCKKIKSNDDKERTRDINGIKYAFDENGVMISGFTDPGKIDLTQENNPSVTKKTYLYNDDTDGSNNISKWVWTYSSEDMDAVENADQEYHWWRTDKDGKILNNTIKEIDGKKYAFDGIGRLKAGFVLSDETRKYVANFQPEDLTKDDFLYGYFAGGKLYGHELADLRYFGDDDVGDGSMKTGKMEIELSDGIYTFEFNSQGIAIGNRNMVKKRHNAYYLNGLKLTPNEDYKYGIIKLKDNQYKLVKKSGTVAKGNGKVIVDDDGGYVLLIGNDVVGYKPESTLPGSNTQIKWRKASTGVTEGFWYYDKDADSKLGKYHFGICQPSSVTSLSDIDKSYIEEDMRINFKY